MSESEDGFKFVLKLHNTIFTNVIRHFIDFAEKVKKWWIFSLLLYCLCIKDFIDIYLYSTLTITKRTLWMLQAVGLLRKIKNDSYVSHSNKIVQTDMIRMKDAQSSPFEHRRTKKLHSSSQTSPPCKLKLSFSPPKLKDDETKAEEMQKMPEKSPAVLKLEAEIPRKETNSPTPLCNINLSLTPTVETRIKETDNLSPEERNFLKRKWQSWKLKRYIRKMKTRSISLNCQENSDGVFTYPEDSTFSEWSPDDHNKNLYEEPGTPKSHGCCTSLITKLKSKLHQESDCPAVSYRRF
ncbi:unnamed protein product [Larinioides sclopetarius]